MRQHAPTHCPSFSIDSPYWILIRFYFNSILIIHFYSIFAYFHYSPLITCVRVDISWDFIWDDVATCATAQARYSPWPHCYFGASLGPVCQQHHWWQDFRVVTGCPRVGAGAGGDTTEFQRVESCDVELNPSWIWIWLRWVMMGDDGWWWVMMGDDGWWWVPSVTNLPHMQVMFPSEKGHERML